MKTALILWLWEDISAGMITEEEVRVVEGKG